MSNRVKEHVFISYDHQDTKIAKRIAADLEEAGIKTWIDQIGLKPGTPNWNHVVRDAIRRSFALLLVASPHSGESRLVPDELELAKSYECLIHIVWVVGDEWIHCVPMGWGQHQYVDCRGRKYKRNLPSVIRSLQEEIKERAEKYFLWEKGKTLPSGYLSIDIDQDSLIALRPQSYDSLRSLLDDLYGTYLASKYEPFTYGKDWILIQETGVGFPLVPWSWLLKANRQQKLSSYERGWARLLPKAYDIVEQTSYRVVESPLAVVGIVTSLPQMVNLLNDPRGPVALGQLFGTLAEKGDYVDDKDLKVKIIPAEKMEDDSYRYRFLITIASLSANWSQYDGKVMLVERWDWLEHVVVFS